MKIKYTAFAFLSLLVGFVVAASSHVEVEMTIARTLTLDEIPVDSALSAGGKYIFVLTSPRLTGGEQRLVRLISK